MGRVKVLHDALEIASGSPLTEEELNGTPNRECPSFWPAILFLNGCAAVAVKELQSYKIEKKREPLSIPNARTTRLNRCRVDCSNKRQR